MKRALIAVALLLSIGLGAVGVQPRAADASATGCAITIYAPTLGGGAMSARGYWNCTYTGQYYVEVNIYRWNGPGVYWQWVGGTGFNTYTRTSSAVGYASPCYASGAQTYRAQIYIYRYASGAADAYMGGSTTNFVRCG